MPPKKRKEQPASAAAEKASKRHPKPPPPPRTRSTRSNPTLDRRASQDPLYKHTEGEKVTCLVFGPDRKTRYPAYWFCGNCQTYESLLPDKRKLVSRQGARYVCQATHKNPLCPTQKQQIEICSKSSSIKKPPAKKLTYSQRIMPVYCEFSDDDTEEEEKADCKASPMDSDDAFPILPETTYDSPPAKQTSGVQTTPSLYELLSPPKQATNPLISITTIVAAEKQALQEARDLAETHVHQIVGLQSLVAELKRKLENEQKRNKRMENNLLSRTFQGSMEDKTKAHLKCIAELCGNGKRQRKRIATVVVETVVSDEYLGGLTKDKSFRWACKILRVEVYNAENLAKLCDNELVPLETVEKFRSLQTQGKKYYRGSVIACEKDIRRVFAAMEAYADIHIPCEYGSHDGEYDFVRIQPKDVVEKTLTAFGVGPTTERKVNIAQSMDGTRITKNLNCVVSGFKVNDKAATCPVTKKPLFANNSNDKEFIQSRKNCFPLHVAMMPEKKETYSKYCKSDIEFLKDECERLNLKCATDTDLSATWKVLQKGGAMKKDDFACHCCAREKSELSKPNDASKCDMCKDLFGSNISQGHRCFHDEFLTEKRVDELQDILCLMDEELSPLAEKLVNDTEGTEKLQHAIDYVDPRGEITRDLKASIRSIHFDLATASTGMRQIYLQKLINDLQTRKLDAISGSLKEKQKRLLEAMTFEFEYMECRQKIEHGGKGRDKALFLLLDCVPCVLHMENRVGLKVFTQLLKQGLMYIQDQDNELGTSTSAKKQLSELIEKAEGIVNKQILGAPTSPAHWTCPTNEKKTKIGTITMDGERTRKVMDNLELLIDEVIFNDNKKSEWKDSIGYYRDLMKTLRKKQDFTETEILEYQKIADKFYLSWFDLCGVDGLTNYIHMIGSGHLVHYLRYWKNLYVHSQQGWEAFNNLLKLFYLRRTQRGGSSNRGKGPKDRIKPIGRWLQRRYLWAWGVTSTQAKEFLASVDPSMDEDEMLENHDSDEDIANVL